MIQFNFNCYVNISVSTKQRNLYNKGNYREFRKILDEKNWEQELPNTDDLDKNWNTFVTIIKELEDKYIPKRKNRQIGKSNTFPMDEKKTERKSDYPKRQLPVEILK